MAGGVNGLVKTAGELGGLVTGNMDNAVTQFGDRGQQFWEDQKSDVLKSKIRARKANIDAQDSTLGKAWAAARDTMTDPALAADTVANNLPTMLPGAAVGRGVALARAGAALAGAEGVAGGFLSAAARQAAEEAAAKSAATWGTRAAIGTGAVQQGADVSQQAYDDAMAKPDAVWDANPQFQAELRANGGDRNAAKQAIATQSARATMLPATAISVRVNWIKDVEAITGRRPMKWRRALSRAMSRIVLQPQADAVPS